MSPPNEKSNKSASTPKNKDGVAEKESLGISTKKSGDLSDWYTQVVLKAELADYASGKGFIVLRPYG